MASAPSASALSAVMRCRGNIWKRNPQSKRPAVGVYSSLGMGRSPAPARADLLLRLRGGEPASPGRRRVTLALKSHQDRVESAGDKNSRELGKLRYPRVAQCSGSAHQLPAVHDALVCQLARGLLSFLPSWTDKFSGVVRTVTYQGRGSRAWETALAQELGSLPAGALKVSLISPCSVGNSGHAPCLASSSWTTLKSACLSLTALVSGVMCSRLAVLFRYSSSEPAQLDRRQSEESKQQVSLKKKTKQKKHLICYLQ